MALLPEKGKWMDTVQEDEGRHMDIGKEGENLYTPDGTTCVMPKQTLKARSPKPAHDPQEGGVTTLTGKGIGKERNALNPSGSKPVGGEKNVG